MHIRVICKLAEKRTLHSLLLYIASVFLCFTVFLLLLISVFAWKFTSQGKTLCDKCLNGGIKQAGAIEIENFSTGDHNNINNFEQQAGQLDEITGIGSSGCFGNDSECLRELMDRQTQMEGTDASSFWFVSVNWEGAGVCKFDLQQGKPPEEYERQEDVLLLYLGSSYSDIPVGTVYEVKGEPGYTYYVAGILEKGMKWISEDIYLEDVIVDSHYVENLDHYAVVIGDDINSFRLTYTVKEGYTVKEAEKKLIELAEQNGLDMNFAMLSDIIEEREHQHGFLIHMIQKIFVSVVVAAFFLLLCTQLSEMMDDMRYFGILYANGASTKDIICILFGENLLKVFVAFLLAVFAMYFVLKAQWHMFQPGVEAWENAKYLLFFGTMGPALLAGGVLVVLTAMIPALWLKKKSPVELMQGYRM